MNEEKLNGNLDPKEKNIDAQISLRPKSIDEFIGQKNIKSNLKTFIQSSKKRKKNLDHIILYGPPGLGKTVCQNHLTTKNVSLKSKNCVITSDY